MSKYVYRELSDGEKRRRKALKEELEYLAEYCARRASLEFQADTTISNLRKKVLKLQARVFAAGVAREIAPPEE